MSEVCWNDYITDDEITEIALEHPKWLMFPIYAIREYIRIQIKERFIEVPIEHTLPVMRSKTVGGFPFGYQYYPTGVVPNFIDERCDYPILSEHHKDFNKYVNVAPAGIDRVTIIDSDKCKEIIKQILIDEVKQL